MVDGMGCSFTCGCGRLFRIEFEMVGVTSRMIKTRIDHGLAGWSYKFLTTQTSEYVMDEILERVSEMMENDKEEWRCSWEGAERFYSWPKV